MADASVAAIEFTLSHECEDASEMTEQDVLRAVCADNGMEGSIGEIALWAAAVQWGRAQEREAIQKDISPVLNGCTVSKYATASECRAARSMAEQIKAVIRARSEPETDCHIKRASAMVR